MSNMPQRTEPQGSDGTTQQKKSAKEHTRNLHAWLHQVVEDISLPHTAFKVAYIIGEHINRESGDAWPSTERIGRLCGLKQSSVVGLVRKLEAAGHLAIDPGRAGRGKSHHYSPVLKHRGADVLRGAFRREDGAAKTSGPPPENIVATAVKYRGHDMNSLEQPITTKSAPSARSSECVDRGEDISIDTARAYGALYEVYPMDLSGSSEHASMTILEQHLRNGEPFAEINEAAAVYSRQVSQDGGTVMPMADWLRSSPWKNRRSST